MTCLQSLLDENNDLYIIIQLDNEFADSESEIQDLFCKLDGFEEHKLLFCSTEAGVAHIARHISPVLHADSSLENVHMLDKFLPFILLIGTEDQEGLPLNVTVAPRLTCHAFNSVFT